VPSSLLPFGTGRVRWPDRESAAVRRRNRGKTVSCSPVTQLDAAEPLRRRGDVLWRGLDWLVARGWWVLTVWTVVWGLAHVGSGYGWHYFVTGTRLLFSPEALHLYARHPELQIGPLSFVAAAPFVLVLSGRVGELAAMACMSAAGLYLMAQLRRLQPTRSVGSDREWLVVGLLFVPVWSEVAVHWAHPDDVLALLLGVAALRAIRADRPVLTGLLLAAATDCKPWAAGFAALVLLTGQRRRAAVAWAGGVALAWLPFVVGDPATLGAGRFRITNDAASVIRVFGVHTAGTPTWDRPTQLVAAVLVVAVAAVRGRWGAGLLLAIVVRLLLDPATKNYYDAGLVTGTAVYDLALLAGAVPWLTIGTCLFFWLPSYALVSQPHDRALLRAGVLLGLLVIGVAGDRLGIDRGTPMTPSRRPPAT